MPAIKRVLESGSKRKFNPIRNFKATPTMTNMSYESLHHRVESMKEQALELKAKLEDCEKTMANVEEGMEKLQERVQRLHS